MIRHMVQHFGGGGKKIFYECTKHTQVVYVQVVSVNPGSGMDHNHKIVFDGAYYYTQLKVTPAAVCVMLYV